MQLLSLLPHLGGQLLPKDGVLLLVGIVDPGRKRSAQMDKILCDPLNPLLQRTVARRQRRRGRLAPLDVYKRQVLPSR